MTRLLTRLALTTALVTSPVLALRAAGDQFVYFGTYTNGKSQSKGIYVAEFDSKTGKLGGLTLAAETKNPSFVAIAPSKKFLYSV
jgi:6-phosphogluconolactonase